MPCNCGQHRTPQGCAGARSLARLPADRKIRKPSGQPKASRRTGPLCACGCGRRCHPRKTWARPACVPRTTRQAAGRKSRAASVARHRAARFRLDLDRVLVDGRRINREELLATFMVIYTRGYNAGMSVLLRRAEAA